MNREDFAEHFRTLEVDPNATFQEIRRAYHHLRELFSKNSIVLNPVKDELDPESQEDIILQIDHAYKELCFYFNEKETEESRQTAVPALVPMSMPAPADGYSGPVLRQLREGADIRLSDIALATRIRLEYLENIEKESYDGLPPAVFLRGYVASYAAYLSLDPVQVTRDFMNRYEKSRR